MTAVSEQDPAEQSLADIEVVLADSREALEYAYACGLPKSAVLRTASPALAMETGLNVEALEKDITPADVMALDAATLPFSVDLYKALIADPELEDFALDVARVALNFQTLVYKAMALREADFHRPIAVVKLDTGSEQLDAHYNGPWKRILTSNPEAQVIVVPREELPPIKQGVQKKVDFLTRLSFEDWQSIGYRLCRDLFDRVPLTSPRGTILIHSENELLREVVFRLALKGFSLRWLRAPKTSRRPLDRKIGEALTCRVRPVVGQHLRAWVVAGAVAPMEEIFVERSLDAAERYANYVSLWTETLNGLSKTRPKAVLANFPFTPEAVALYKACRARNLPLVTAQHGASRELNSRMRYSQAYYENNAADLFFTFNRRAAEIANNENEFARGRAVAVGMPAGYWRGGNYRKRRADAPPIVFVSTTHYIGNVQMIQAGGPDHYKAAYEIALIESVLAQLRYPVLFKPYPAVTSRYLDPDPIVERARAQDNITVFEEGTDLRYLLADSRVLITSRAMSTVAWCLMANKPLVYIDIPDLCPLRPETRAAFEKGLFLFDGGCPSLHEDLRTFLSKPLDEIEALWAQRAEARARLIDEFIATGGPGAGKRAAEYLMDFITDKTAA